MMQLNTSLTDTSYEEECTRKKVLIIYTGGTLGMTHNEHGALEPKPGFLTQYIEELPEFRHGEMPQYTIIEYSPLIDSSCMTPADWVKMATDIETNYLLYDGFVIIMGTDTMAYTASALSFMLESLAKPVILTGAQIPIAEVYSDARRNLIVSVIFAGNSSFHEVCICFGDHLIRGSRAIKSNSNGLHAFTSPNFPPIATLGVALDENTDLMLPIARSMLRVHKRMDAKIVVLRLTPGFDYNVLRIIVQQTPELKGVVVEMFGSGNSLVTPVFLDAIREARSKGIVVVATTQCLHGGVSLDIYAVGRSIAEAGIISGVDMTVEAITTKLAYLCGRFPNISDVERWMGISIRGELTGPQSTTKKPYFDSSPGSASAGTRTPVEAIPLRDAMKRSSFKNLP